MTRIAMISAAALIAMTGVAGAAAHKAKKMDDGAMMHHHGTVVNQDPYYASRMGGALLSGAGDSASGAMIDSRFDIRGTRTSAGVTHDDAVANENLVVPYIPVDGKRPDVRGTKTNAGVTHSN
ncbi:hypothetical protein [Minwuia sp.]|uniref:hypothetical protein n=1 Tax=Minwuia sp. TaxID=2493630 RepID=UPI003A921A31